MTKKLRGNVDFLFHGIYLELTLVYKVHAPEPENNFSGECELLDIWHGDNEIEEPSKELTEAIVLALAEVVE